MRKIALLLAIVMTFLIVLPTVSFGEPEYNKKMEEAIIKSKQLFNIIDEYDTFDSSVSSYDGNTIFYLNWNDSSGKLGGISVSVYSDGTIINYNKYKANYDENYPKLPKISKEEGLNIALKYIEKVNPYIANNLKYSESKEPLNPKSREYNYGFFRIENNVPYIDNSLIVSIDKNSGELLSYNLNWDRNLSFPKKNNIISLEDAKKLYKEKMGLSLVYKTDYTSDTPRMYLVYTTLYGQKGIEANTGELFNYKRYGFLDEYNELNTKANGNVDLSPDERKAVEGISNLLSEEQIENSAREILEIDTAYKLNDLNLYSYWKNKGEYVWTMNFNKEEEENIVFSYDVSLDAKTGELKSFYYQYPEDKKSEIKFDRIKALEIARDYIKKIEPDKVEEIELFENILGEKEKDTIYNFNFIRKHNQAYIASDSISVSVDGKSGQVIGYNRDWFKGEIPDLDNNISLDDAYEILFNEIGMKLEYVEENKLIEGKELSKNIVLAYLISPDKPLNISAETGEILDYNGKPFKVKTIQRYIDIDESYAKEKIEVLAEHGLELPGNRFKPKEKITQSEFLYLLAKTNTPNFNLEDERAIENLYNYLINMKVIEESEKSPDETITKEESIKYIIKMMKYDKIAEATYIYKDIFKDSKEIDENLLGYISVARGLNIVEGNNGYIRPKSELSREDAAIMIYNYLFNE
ncbi:YcdB/YcdC domain-containing protein [Anaerosalibacter sp. Marseille-P3206]|uniref:YcdB/YcdC domain-containing protein n=1 Tax=Anaerosalibacter sp. Marseille-P3206 TaxID=1871005 RepID=UPI000984BCBF|nr:YcdB/YcdC domain-containing protein [Anaerosalibacter sp. Marseille-P3206]